MRFYLDNQEITLMELKNKIDNLYVDDFSFEICELNEVNGDNLYFEIIRYGIYD